MSDQTEMAETVDHIINRIPRDPYNPFEQPRSTP